MRAAQAALVLLALGCGSLTETEDGVTFLEVLPPAKSTLEVGETLQLQARTLDARGEPVEAEVRWLSADDFLEVEELTGLVTALEVGTGGRVQASTGGGTRMLFSEPVSLTVVAPPPPPPPPPPPSPAPR